MDRCDPSRYNHPERPSFRLGRDDLPYICASSGNSNRPRDDEAAVDEEGLEEGLGPVVYPAETVACASIG